MIELEARTADALRRIADRIDVVPDLRAVVTDTRTLPIRSLPSRRRSFAVLAGAAAVLVAALVVVVVQRGDRHPAQPIETSPPPVSWDLPLSWATPLVRLAAQAIRVQVDAVTYDVPASATAESAEDQSGPAAVQRLTLNWIEDDRSIALTVPISASGTEWQLGGPSLEIDGVMAGRIFQAEEIGAPFGSAYVGDFVTSSTVDGVTMSVVATGLQVEGFRNRAADGSFVAVEGSPPVTVAAPALPADVPPTGVHLDAEQSMLLVMGPDALRLECLRRGGFDVPNVPDELIAASFGGGAGARANGYHGPVQGVLNGGQNYGDSLSDEEQAAFLTALGAGNGSGCWGEVATAQPVPDLTHDEQSRLWVLPAQVQPEVLADPRVVAVLGAWGGCVEAAIGERAPTPDGLAARFRQGDQPSDREKQVAEADLICRAQTDFERVWATVQTERERALLGPEVAFYDEMARRYQTLLAYYAAELEQRGITLPSLG
jgi:hypothetical protein